MNIDIRSELPPHSTAQDVFGLLIKSRLGAGELKVESKTFLSPPYPTTLSLVDFGFEQSYIDNAMDTVWRCHPDHPKNKFPDRPIVVYTDYDADGITGGAVLWETLHTLGFRVFPYTPNRITEGYGFSTVGLDLVKEKYDPALIISVDHGIVADTQVTYASEKLGIPIIVTDHHHRSEERVPKLAKAIFHIPALSGSGTAYYVAKEITYSTKYKVQSTKSDNSELGTQNLERMFETDYAGIAAIGTIADLVPLLGPSRNMAFHGLKALTDTTRPGLMALKKVSDHVGKTITTYEVGFLLAPRINASGRLEDALDALRLLCTKDTTKAQLLAEKLNALNVQRQDMVKKAAGEALEIVELQKKKEGVLPKILIVHQQSGRPSAPIEYWHEGIIGLIASKICDEFYRPTLVLTQSEAGADGIPLSYKASCRSIPGFHMTEYLTAHQRLLLKFGGHEAAAGFSITTENLAEFVRESQMYAGAHLTDAMLE
ncbi:DHH family phosphoesterase, partial [Candidatus Woesebacteria bacterium]|nr:DHH family phosphoesterase [Candidatus Woesebacteria bacterium]